VSGLADRLPRVGGLLAFEAAARCASFTAAARELKVTQSAVSQHVRAVEAELGTRLFVRKSRGLELSEEGRLLYQSVSMGFESMAAAIDQLRAARKPTVTVGTTTSIASFWLIPRLQGFRALYPDIDVSIVGADLGFNTVTDSIDVGFVFGRGSWPGFRASRLRDGDVFPVCSPSYLGGRPPLTDVSQLLGETLLTHESDKAILINWPQFFARLGVRTAYHRRIKYNSLSLLLQATCEGQGVALGWSLLTDELLESGALVRPLPRAVVNTEGAYYFVASERKSNPEVLAFEEWVLAQFPPRTRRRRRDVGTAGTRTPARPRRQDNAKRGRPGG
jgi:DNA-binding transcriptional LysR family regulator